MSDINKVILIGRLTRDPELKATQGGKAFCEFSLASNKVWIKDGEKKESAGFFDCVTWGKLAETASKYFQKGKRAGTGIGVDIFSRKIQRNKRNQKSTGYQVFQKMFFYHNFPRSFPKNKKLDLLSQLFNFYQLLVVLFIIDSIKRSIARC